MRKLFTTKEEVLLYKIEIEKLLVKCEGDQKFCDFLKDNLRILKKLIENIEIGDYAPYVKLAYESSDIFKYYALKIKDLKDSLPNYESSQAYKNASETEKIHLRLTAIDKELNELAEPIRDYAFEILFNAYNAVKDYQTNSSSLTIKDHILIDGSNDGDDVHMNLKGFKEARFWFYPGDGFPLFHAIDENGNEINMKVIEGFECSIGNTDSNDCYTSGDPVVHLRKLGGIEKINEILVNLGNAVNNFAIQRNPELESVPQLDYEQGQIAKANIIKFASADKDQINVKKKKLTQIKEEK